MQHKIRWDSSELRVLARRLIELGVKRADLPIRDLLKHLRTAQLVLPERRRRPRLDNEMHVGTVRKALAHEFTIRALNGAAPVPVPTTSTFGEEWRKAQEALNPPPAPEPLPGEPELPPATEPEPPPGVPRIDASLDMLLEVAVETIAQRFVEQLTRRLGELAEQVADKKLAEYVGEVRPTPPKIRKPRILIVGLWDNKKKRVEEEFPSLDLRVINSDVYHGLREKAKYTDIVLVMADRVSHKQADMFKEHPDMRYVNGNLEGLRRELLKISLEYGHKEVLVKQ